MANEQLTPRGQLQQARGEVAQRRQEVQQQVNAIRNPVKRTRLLDRRSREQQRRFLEEDAPAYLRELDVYEQQVLSPYEQQIIQAEQAQAQEDPSQAYRVARKYFNQGIPVKYAKGLVRNYLQQLYRDSGEARVKYLQDIKSYQEGLPTPKEIQEGRSIAGDRGPPAIEFIPNLKTGDIGVRSNVDGISFPSIEAYNNYVGKLNGKAPTPYPIASLKNGRVLLSDGSTQALTTERFNNLVSLGKGNNGTYKSDRDYYGDSLLYSKYNSGNNKRNFLLERPSNSNILSPSGRSYSISSLGLDVRENGKSSNKIREIRVFLNRKIQEALTYVRSKGPGYARLIFENSLNNPGVAREYATNQEFAKQFNKQADAIATKEEAKQALFTSVKAGATLALPLGAATKIGVIFSDPINELSSKLYNAAPTPRTRLGKFAKGAVGGYIANYLVPSIGIAQGYEFAEAQAKKGAYESGREFAEFGSKLFYGDPETLDKASEMAGFLVGGGLINKGVAGAQQFNPLTKKPVRITEPSINTEIAPFTRPRVVALIKDETGQVIGQKGYLFAIDKKSGNYISIGGGKEVGQTLSQALLAELKQEANIGKLDIASKKLVDKYVTPRDTYFVYEVQLRPNSAKRIKAGSDVSGLKVLKGFRGYTGPSAAFPTGRPSVFGLFGRKIRSEDAYLIARTEGLKKVRNYLDTLSPQQKLQLDLVARDWFIRNFGEKLTRGLTRKQITRDYLLGRLKLLPTQLYLRNRLGDFLLAPTSRYNIPRGRQAEFAKGEEQLLSSGSPSSIASENLAQALTGKRRVIGSKTQRGEASGLYLSPPRQPGGKGYVGLVYLGIGEETGPLRFGFNKRKTPVVYVTKEKISGELYEKGARSKDVVQDYYNKRPGTIQPTPKSLSGRELEVIATPNTIFKVVSGGRSVRIGFRKVLQKEVRLVKVRPEVAERVRLNLNYIRDPFASGQGKARALEQLRRDTGIDYSEPSAGRYVQLPRGTGIRREAQRERARPIENYLTEPRKERRSEIERPRRPEPRRAREQTRDPLREITRILTPEGPREPPRREPPARVREPPRGPERPRNPTWINMLYRASRTTGRRQAKTKEKKKGRPYLRRPTEAQLLFNLTPKRRVPLSKLTGFEIAI